METFGARATMAHGWIVRVAGASTSMLLGTEWVMPPPAHVWSAVTLLEWVTTVPFAIPQSDTGCVTDTVAEPDLALSSLLFALTV